MSCIDNLSYLGSWSYIVRLPLQTKQRKTTVLAMVWRNENPCTLQGQISNSLTAVQSSMEIRPKINLAWPSNSSSERATKRTCRLLGSTQEAETFLGYLVIRPHSRALHNCPKSGAAQKSNDKWMDWETWCRHTRDIQPENETLPCATTWLTPKTLC